MQHSPAELGSFCHILQRFTLFGQGRIEYMYGNALASEILTPRKI
jgi:hypothetical protein